MILIETHMTSADTTSSAQASEAAEAADLTQRVQQVINRIRPAVQADGGDVALVSVDDDGKVLVKMSGACVGCPSSQITLKMGIERNLKELVPEVTSVEATEN